MIELPDGGRLYTEDEEMPTVEELIASMTPDQLAASAAVIERLHALQDTFEDDTGQTLYTSVLLPCPFCGAGADPDGPRPWVQTWRFYDEGWETRVVCGGCHVSTSREVEGGRVTYLPTMEDVTRLLAIEKSVAAWNRRA